MIKLRLLFFFTALYTSAVAQNTALVYDNVVYKSSIKTVECYNSKKEQSFPIIALRSGETLTFSFDDLSTSSTNYRYSIEHCTADWKPSRINNLDFVESFNEDIVSNYRLSFNTLQKFTNYKITLPNDQIRPKISGNYLLKVYENNNPQQLVITQRFYVSDNLVNVGAEVAPSSLVTYRNSKQKVNFSVFYQSTPLQNPYLNVKAVVMQNGIPQTAIVNTKPTFVQQSSLVYNDLNANEFWGGNEYRKFDIRSFRYKAEHVQEFFRDTAINVILFTDVPYNSIKYSNQFDENGNFYIRNQEGRDQITDSDYANVLFTLNATPPTPKGNAYVVGRFNNYTLNESNRLHYDTSRKRFYGNIKVKQGLYDFKYVWIDENGTYNDTVFEGSFFETENTYQVLVYYRKPGGRWDELIGFTNINNYKR